MALKMLVKSLLNIRSLGVLSAVLIGYYFSKWEPLIVVSFLCYMVSAGILLLNPKFRQKCIVEDKIKNLNKLNFKAANLYFRVKTKVGKNFTTRIIERILNVIGKITFVDFEARIDNMFSAKTEIVNSFLNKEYSSIREKIAFKALELSIVYFRLMDIYISRLADVSSRNLAAIEGRMSINQRKKNSSINQAYSNDLERVIEADKRLLDRLREARKEVEKMSAKLNLIESTMALLKQQVYTDFYSDEIFENIENTINEAQALESALSNHNSLKKMKM